MVEISVSALTIAISSIDRDIKAREAAMREGRVPDAELDQEGQEVLDMMKSLSELCDTYETVARRDDPTLPPLESWLPPNTSWY
jgi:hypothetical protein